MNTDEMRKRIDEKFGSRIGFLGFQIIELSKTGQPCDITFYNKNPVFDVKIDQQIALAMIYGAGAKMLQEKLNNIRLSNGDNVGIDKIWTINPMPKGGISKTELDAVDLADAESKDGPNGETLRQMISETYHCENREEEDKYLRRFIAS